MENKAVRSILISIHPEHVDKIVSGEKCFEYRKTAIKAKKAVIYATSPVKRIIAIASIEEVISDSPQAVWRQTRGGAGIDYSFFYSYFSGCKRAYAIKLGAVKVLNESLPLYHNKLNLHAPQSFIYLDDKRLSWLNTKPHITINPGLIFIAGIHGAGKTTLTQKIFSLFGYKSFSASQLIKASAGEVRDDKFVSDIDDNQRKLLMGLASKREQYLRVILDGHFCLINDNGNIEDIPLDVFKDINPACIVVATPTLEVLEKRLQERKNPLNLSVPLHYYYKRESERAELVAKHLSVPLYKIDTGLGRRSQFKQVAKVYRHVFSDCNKHAEKR